MKEVENMDERSV